MSQPHIPEALVPDTFRPASIITNAHSELAETSIESWKSRFFKYRFPGAGMDAVVHIHYGLVNGSFYIFQLFF